MNITMNKKTSAFILLRHRLSTSLKLRRMLRRVKVVSPLRLRSGISSAFTIVELPTSPGLRRTSFVKSGFTIVELLVIIVVIGILATLTIIAYTGIQQKAIVASINSDLDNASRSLKLFQVENNDNYPLTNDCSSTPAANSICLKSSPGNSYTVFETNNSGSRSFCLTVKNSTTNAKYHITQDSAPTLGVCPFGFATTLTATTASPTSIDLVWDTVTDATSYTLEQATDESFTTDLTTIATQPGTSFTSISLSQGTTYYYRVNATIDGDISGWSNTDDATTSIDAPDAPTVSANTVTDTTTWSWNTPTCPAGSARYQYRYTIAPSGSDSGLVPIASSPIGFTTNTEGQTYTVQVQAQCFLGAIISSWSTSGQASYYRPNNNYVKTWGGTNADYGWSLVQTSDGGYAVTGYTYSYGAGSADVYLAKYDSAGTLSWSKTWGGTGISIDQGYSLVQTSDGGYAVTGYTQSYGAGGYDMFLAKFNSTGTLSWNKTWGGTGNDYCTSIIYTSDGGYAVTGQTNSYGAGGYDMFLVKYDSAGTLTWSKTWGGAGYDLGKSLVQTSDGGYAVTGQNASYGAGGMDMFLVKYTSVGVVSWSKTWGGAGSDAGTSLVQTSDGGYAVTGHTANYGAGADDMILVKYDSAGTLTWSKTWGGADYDHGTSLIKTSDDGYAVAGWTSYGAGVDDMFLAKYNSSGVIVNCSSPMCQSPSATVTSPSATVTSPSATVTSPSATVTSPSATFTSPSATSTVIVAP